MEDKKICKDLKSLNRGDVVSLICVPEVSCLEETGEYTAAYHGMSELGQLQFIYPENPNSLSNIVMRMAKPDKIRIDEDGKIRMSKTSSVEQTFIIKVNEYAELNNTLTMARMR